jgi:hypothetical protein
MVVNELFQQCGFPSYGVKVVGHLAETRKGIQEEESVKRGLEDGIRKLRSAGLESTRGGDVWTPLFLVLDVESVKAFKAFVFPGLLVFGSGLRTKKELRLRRVLRRRMRYS